MTGTDHPAPVLTPEGRRARWIVLVALTAIAGAVAAAIVTGRPAGSYLAAAVIAATAICAAAIGIRSALDELADPNRRTRGPKQGQNP